MEKICHEQCFMKNIDHGKTCPWSQSVHEKYVFIKKYLMALFHNMFVLSDPMKAIQNKTS